MRIATITVNPAIDQTVKVDNFTAGAVNRSQDMRLDAGGKGVNVASFLADYGMNVSVTGFLGDENADVFVRLFNRKGILDHFVRIPGETRVNIKIMDEVNQVTTDLNNPGQVPGEYAIARLFDAVEELAKVCDIFVLSGNIQAGLPTNFYARIIQFLRTKKRVVVLDTSGESLIEALKAGPDVIKPNIHELGAVLGKELKSPEEAYQAACALLTDEIRTIVISMGGEGAIFMNSETAFIAKPPSVNIKSTVGAGDAMVAGLVAGIAKKLSLEETARLATAFSVNAVTRLGRDLPPVLELEAIKQQVTIHPIL